MALRNQLTALTTSIFAMLLVAAHSHAASTTPPVEKNQPETGQKQIEFSASKLTNERRARALKTAADYNFTQNNLDLAASFYLRALALAPEIFSVEEKKQIANRLATAHHQNEAIEVLRQLALEHGDDAEIRVNLAKLLSATQDYSAAIAEVDKILNQDHGNKYALLVKANSLRSQQKFGQSAALYRSILKDSEDFDARLGLTYSLLAMGEKTRARDSFGKMKTEDEDQQQQIDELGYYLKSVTRPTVDLYSATLTDSDKNRTSDRRVTLRGTGTDWDLAASYDRKSAHSIVEDPDTVALPYTKLFTASSIAGSASANFSEVLRLTLKLGQTKLDADTQHAFITRGVTVDLKTGQYPLSIVSVDISHDVLTTTGTQIARMVELDQSSIKYTRALNARTTLNLNYRYKQYASASDTNTANDFQGSAQYVLYRGAPFINVGYVYRHMNYNHIADDNYFDPQNYRSNQAYVTLYYELSPFYFDFETDYGQQTYDRYEVKNRDSFKFASATIGTAATKRLHLELHSEYNGSTSLDSGYKYHDLLISAQVSYMF